LNYARFAQEKEEGVTLNLAAGTWLEASGQSTRMPSSTEKLAAPEPYVSQGGAGAPSPFITGRSPLSSLLPERGGHIKIKSVGTVDYTDTKLRRNQAAARYPSSSKFYGSTSIGQSGGGSGIVSGSNSVNMTMVMDSSPYPTVSTPPQQSVHQTSAIIAHNQHLINLAQQRQEPRLAYQPHLRQQSGGMPAGGGGFSPGNAHSFGINTGHFKSPFTANVTSAGDDSLRIPEPQLPDARSPSSSTSVANQGLIQMNQ